MGNVLKANYEERELAVELAERHGLLKEKDAEIARLKKEIEKLKEKK